MAYIKNTWVDQEGQVRYRETQDGDFKILTPNYEQVTEIGTPVNADNMNHIENGIADCDTAITGLQNSKVDKTTYNADMPLKADADLSNINPTQTVKNTIITWGMLDWNNKINTKPVGSGNAYVAVTPCVYIACMQAPAGSDGGSLYVNGIKHTAVNRQDGYNQNVSVYLPLDTGDSIYWTKSLGNVISTIVPFKGVS